MARAGYRSWTYPSIWQAGGCLGSRGISYPSDCKGTSTRLPTSAGERGFAYNSVGFEASNGSSRTEGRRRGSFLIPSQPCLDGRVILAPPLRSGSGLADVNDALSLRSWKTRGGTGQTDSPSIPKIHVDPPQPLALGLHERSSSHPLPPIPEISMAQYLALSHHTPLILLRDLDDIILQTRRRPACS